MEKIPLKETQRFGNRLILLAHERREVTDISDELWVRIGTHHGEVTKFVIKELFASVDIDKKTVCYFVQVTEDQEPAFVEPHGRCPYSETFDNKEDAIRKYNEIEI